jgi:endonuclease/exonuclease/phosphatase family metal-dependent hydrolase
MNADVLGLVEMGSLASTTYLLDELKRAGMDYSHYEWMRSNDGQINLVIFSRYPLKKIVHHTQDKYVLDERSYSLRRGILEATVEVTDSYSFTVLLTHLKSQLESTKLDQQEVRLEEAKLLRGKVEKILEEDPEADFVVIGDLNDHYSSLPIRTILGTSAGKRRLLDARPLEQIGDSLPEERTRGKFRSVAWTYFYSKEDTIRVWTTFSTARVENSVPAGGDESGSGSQLGSGFGSSAYSGGFTLPVAKKVQKSRTSGKSSLKPALK